MIGTQKSQQARRLQVWLSSLLLVGAVAGAAEAGPVISISPDPIRFFGPPLFFDPGGAPGQKQSGSYEVRNVGDAPLIVTGMAINGPAIMTFDGQFDPFCGSGQTCAQTFSLAPQESRNVLVTCTAVQAGFFDAALDVVSNATSGASTAAMSCLGLREPIIQISPAALDFGISHSCFEGDFCGPTCATQPSTQTLTITNAAAPPSRLDFYIEPELASTVFDDFIIPSGMCPEQSSCVAVAGGSHPIAITFRPRRSRSHTTPLTLVSLYPGQAPIQIPFSAEGGGGRLERDTPSFLGAVPVGQTLTTTFRVHNAGRSCLGFSGPHFFEPEFQLVGTYPDNFLLPSGESFTWTLSCTPTSVGHVSTHFDFDIRDEGIDTDFGDVSCLGLASPLAVTPAAVAFTGANEVPVGTSATQRVTVRNAGTVATDLATITPSDSHFTAALVTGNLPLTLAPDAVADVDITFTPTANVRTAGTIAFHPATGGDFTIDVVGDGILVQAATTPAAFDFGTIATPAIQQIQLHNTGDRLLTVNGISLDLPNDFTVTGIASGTTIAAGATIGFAVHATPAMLGRRRATLAIDLDRGADLTIPLDALAIDPALVVTTADAAPGDYEVDFGGVDVDVGAKTSNVTLHNTSATPIVIATCSIAGDAELGIASTCPLAIPGNATVDLAITFAPTAEAQSSAIVTLTGTGFTTGSLRLPLHGIGVDQHVSLSALSVAFPDTFRRPVDAPTRTIEIRNTATTELVLSAISVSGGGFSLIGPATATIAPGASHDVAVGFAPAMAGDASGQLVLGNASDPQIARVELTGRGIGRTVEASPLAIDLGAVTTGSTVRLGSMLADAIAIRNIDAAATFAITSVIVSGNPAFRLIGPDRSSLAPGDRARLDVELAAPAAGRYDATISIFLDGDPDPHAQISVTAQAVDAPPPDTGSGCSTGAPANHLALGVILLLVLRLRRRRA